MSTCTYQGIWKRYEELNRSYRFLEESAYDDGATLAQYAGSDRLARLVSDIESLLDKCSALPNEDDCRKAQAAIIALLYPVEEALADACLFECDQAADSEDYVSSRPCPNPKIVTV